MQSVSAWTIFTLLSIKLGVIVYITLGYFPVVGMGVDNQRYKVDENKQKWNIYKNQNEVRIEGLRINTGYRVFVCGKTKTGLGVEDFIDVKTALESGKCC